MGRYSGAQVLDEFNQLLFEGIVGITAGDDTAAILGHDGHAGGDKAVAHGDIHIATGTVVQMDGGALIGAGVLHPFKTLSQQGEHGFYGMHTVGFPLFRHGAADVPDGSQLVMVFVIGLQCFVVPQRRRGADLCAGI